MAKGTVYFVVSAEVDTGDDTPMDEVLKELAGSSAVLSHEVVMIETPDTVGVCNPKVVRVEGDALFMDDDFQA